jgi:tetratricopeptide (TPR) repeat protein
MRGNTWEQTREFARAKSDYRRAIELDRNNPDFHSSLARLLATCPDPRHRDGKQAVESARTACELTEWKAAALLETLAAAYAESGRFDDAVKTQSQAIALLRDEAQRAACRPRLKLYEEKKPYHQAEP